MASADVAARPALKPALRRVWRDGSTLQIGVDPARALVVGDLDEGLAQWLESLDGTRERADAVDSAADFGAEPAAAGRLLDLLTGAGVIEDCAADRAVLRELSPLERERLGPDVAALSLRGGTADGGATALARRRTRAVTVHGAGRVGASIAVLLAAAGIRYVKVKDPILARPADLAPAGIIFDQVDRRRDSGAQRAAQRAAPGVTPALPTGQPHPHLAIVSPAGPVDRSTSDRLVESGTPHLYAGVRELTGVIGPLVVPGRSSCLRCHDLHRTDRDPGWPRVAAQLAAIERGRQAARAPAPCDVVLATLVASYATMHALEFLDGRLPPSVDGTLEIDSPSGSVRRRSWSAHPACPCDADVTGVTKRPAYPSGTMQG
jgi:bacteriocin biosynthesis cyclodehydratase domain-containing protein